MTTYPLVALIILDGWGLREMEHGNAVVQARTPNYDRWTRELERTIVDASGEAVGLPEGQMGNSEVGHLNLGSGRIVYQDMTRIDKAIKERTFFKDPTLAGCMEGVKAQGGKLHLIGLLGPGGVHSHVRHLKALVELAKQQGVDPIIHVITDGRDTPPQSGIEFVADLEEFLKQEGLGTIATVGGRYYAMDRDKRWPRTEQAYRAIALGQGRTATSAREAVTRSYAEGVTDEFIVPVVIDSSSDRSTKVEPGDGLMFYNFRADRMRQIVESFALPDFAGFEREGGFLKELDVVTFTEYHKDYPVRVVFPEKIIINPLAEVLSLQGLDQFHAAETEKYAHVTYFFNGGREVAFEGEDRSLIPSPKVATYDLKPEMSAYELTEAVVQRVQSHDDAFILVNYANPDMVGHTGVLAAAVKAVEAVDECAGRLVSAIVAKGGVALVTADHGNAERMIDEVTGTPHTYHTTSPVAFFIIGDRYFFPRPRGILADVAPTVLELLGIELPEEMTGKSLLQHM
ncbi:MAG: 2,3-bisphosphoglycerate-independent phosphoglycerate mutase [Chloroflexi bacterium]|nr:2,3-bisphosphoglycerate-independent phosphoglycerate mutase [Chloroflexota bacterium]MCI0580013.1 2,3-bisphosphoglycerate-independent phosphoglycerate mutase [Chloroflexota bacterium]MCI0648462.1 2,3-bisphosphoglycerate-independent phosphoglycerate mutase [Chloroflexota bacterium]MCI0726643.1 2,3-bisphosphoglycerate-independent phosphoglycerate mutase [Chloroflexota bacterium]